MSIKTQEEVIQEYFSQNGITNNLQSSYYTLLGNKILNSDESRLKSFFPQIPGFGKPEWKMSYSLIHNYLNEHFMENTVSSIKDFCPKPQIIPIDNTTQKLRINTKPSPIKNLIKDQKIRKILDSSTLDYDLDKIYYNN